MLEKEEKVEFLLKEYELFATNSSNIFTNYIHWYCFFMGFNLVSLGYSIYFFPRKEFQPLFIAICFFLMIYIALGIIASELVRNYYNDAKERISQIFELTSDKGRADFDEQKLAFQSPIPTDFYISITRLVIRLLKIMFSFWALLLLAHISCIIWPSFCHYIPQLEFPHLQTTK